eukprot:119920_1
MATTVALNATTEPFNSNDHDIEGTIQTVQYNIQKRKKYFCRGIALCCILIVIAFIIIGIYWTKTGGCGRGINVCGDESIMNQKDHGTCIHAVQDELRWNCDKDTADNICCYNRDYAEYNGYWETTTFLKEVNRNNVSRFYDSVTGKLLFIAPIGRSFDEFEKESKGHGWPSFRDEEVVWDNVRCLKDGECVSVDGTHLGHNLPDVSGNRYCINLVSVAGYPIK